MSDSTVTIQVPAQIFHKLVFDYDNSKNTAPFVQKFTSKYEISMSSKTFYEEISKLAHESMEKVGVSAEASASYGPVSASVTANYDNAKAINDSLEKTTRGESEEKITKSQEIIREYTIGANSRAVLYQQCFSAPGFDVSPDVFVSKGEPLKSLSETVIINMTVQKLEFIEYLGVSAVSGQGDRPSIRVREIGGKNDDINAGFSGKYISLIAVYTTDKSKAATGFDLVKNPKKFNFDFANPTLEEGKTLESQEAANKERAAQGKPLISDLAEGTETNLYRFLVPVADPRVPHKITEVALMRSGSNMSLDTVKTLGYSGRSEDLNDERSGDYLYVLWKTRQIA